MHDRHVASKRETANGRRVQNPDDSELPGTRYLCPRCAYDTSLDLHIQTEALMRD